jgi:ribokinase
LLNPAPACPLPEALQRVTDLLTPNEAELHALAGTRDSAAAAQWLLAQGPRALLATGSAAGCLLFGPGRAALSVTGHGAIGAMPCGEAVAEMLWRSHRAAN